MRAIIRDCEALGETAADEFQFLLDWKVDIKVLFSVAGTGAAAADIADSFTIAVLFFNLIEGINKEFKNITHTPNGLVYCLALQ